MRPLAGAIALVLLVPAGLLAQVERPPRRDVLEARIFERFVQRAATELGLDPQARNQLRRHLEESAMARRQLNRQGVAVRMSLARAVRDPTTAEPEFERITAELEALRAADLELWRREQETLRRMLTPRQYAQYVVLFTRFTEQVRALRDGRRGERDSIPPRPGTPAGP